MLRPMFGLGMGEILVIAVVALLFLGPEKLPGAAKSLSKGIRDLRKHTRDLQRTIEDDTQVGGAIRDLKSALRGENLDPYIPPGADKNDGDDNDGPKTHKASAATPKGSDDQGGDYSGDGEGENAAPDDKPPAYAYGNDNADDAHDDAHDDGHDVHDADDADDAPLIRPARDTVASSEPELEPTPASGDAEPPGDSSQDKSHG